jgi:hypothetical protein
VPLVAEIFTKNYSALAAPGARTTKPAGPGALLCCACPHTPPPPPPPPDLQDRLNARLPVALLRGVHPSPAPAPLPVVQAERPLAVLRPAGLPVPLLPAAAVPPVPPLAAPLLLRALLVGAPPRHPQDAGPGPLVVLQGGQGAAAAAIAALPILR